MVEWSVRALQAVAAVRQIVIALPPGSLWASAPEGVVLVSGGVTRSHSVREALRACGAGDPVIVHDAARPLASPALFERVVADLEGSGADAVIAATPVSDTIKELGEDEHTVQRTLERSRLWAVQTPQVFRRAALEGALLDAPDEVLSTATDDARLIEQGGGTVRIVRSELENLKVTSRVDLELAELLLSERPR